MTGRIRKAAAQPFAEFQREIDALLGEDSLAAAPD